MKKKFLATLLVAVSTVFALPRTALAGFSATHDQTLAKASQVMQQWRWRWWRRDRTPPTVKILSSITIEGSL